MYKILEKVLAILMFLSTNETWKQIKSYIISCFKKNTTQKEEEKTMGYPTELSLVSVKYVASAIKDGTVTENVADFAAHVYEVQGFVQKLVFGQPSWATNFSDGPVDLTELEVLSVLEGFEMPFGADPKAVNPATILSAIQLIITLLKALGVIKEAKTTDVLE